MAHFETETYSQAEKKLLGESGFKDAGFTEEDTGLTTENQNYNPYSFLNSNQQVERKAEECSYLCSIGSISQTEALCLLTGVDVDRANYLFDWKGEKIFTMRPDFGLLKHRSNLEIAPINRYEREIQNCLFSYEKEVEAIHRATTDGVIILSAKTLRAQVGEWLSWFCKCGLDLSHIPEKYLPVGTTDDQQKDFNHKDTGFSVPQGTEWSDIKIHIKNDKTLAIAVGKKDP